MSAALPQGFTLDQPAQGGGAALPAGFRLDAPPAPKESPVTDTTSALGYMDPRGPFEAATAMATGTLGSIAGGYAGLAGSVLPGEAGQGADWSKRVSEALTYEPRSKSGQALMKVPEVLSMPIHWAAEKVGAQGEKHSPELATIGKTSVEALPLLLGGRAALKGREPLTAEQQKVAKARDAGYVMTPEEMDAGFIPKQIASAAGEPRLARLTSNKNADAATLKAKGELGIRPDAPLDLDTLVQIRKEAGKAYDEARSIGQVSMDTQYLADLDQLAAKYKSAAKEFKGADKVLQLNEIEDTLAMLRKEDPALQAAQAQGIRIPRDKIPPSTFEASGAIDMIGALRESADAAFRSGKNALGKVMRGGAEALEKQIERHLEGWNMDQIASGVPTSQVLQNFRAAREQIAKTYAIEKALVGDEVNLAELGRQVQKRKPLTGNLKEGGDFARDFERSSQKPNHQATGVSAFDAILSGLISNWKQGGLGWDALTLGARPAMRHILASRPAQWAMDPRTNLSAPALEGVAASETVAPPQKKKR